METVGDIIAFVESYYPRQTAESWDRVGLVVGSRAQPVTKILLAVDPVPEVVAEAIDLGVDLLITHHPLYLRGTSFVSEDDPKGRMVADLIRANCALYSAHTNADIAVGGVAEALATLLGVEDLAPLVPGDNPATGAGRIGTVPQQTLKQFAHTVAARLPKGPNGILVGGKPDRLIERVAVSGGAGDSFLEVARNAGADVFVTADLRHHPASEHLTQGETALISGSHWATEWPWLPLLAQQLNEGIGAARDTLKVEVSTLITEPWALHLPTEGATR